MIARGDLGAVEKRILSTVLCLSTDQTDRLRTERSTATTCLPPALYELNRACQADRHGTRDDRQAGVVIERRLRLRWGGRRGADRTLRVGSGRRWRESSVAWYESRLQRLVHRPIERNIRSARAA